MSRKDPFPLTISLIAPTYNERENLPTLAGRVHRALEGYNYELIVVDDNSPDGTAELAESLSQHYPIKVISRKGERGLASAVVAGFSHARGEVLGVIDADLQHPPERIPELLQAIKDGADVAIASRNIPGGGNEGMNTRRKMVSRGATLLARLFLPSVRKVKDPMSGFFVLKRKVIEGIKLKPIGYKILLEVLVKGRVGAVREVPYVFKPRMSGRSSFDLGEQINYLRHVFTLFTKEREIRRLFQFCLVGGSGYGVQIGLFWLLTRLAGFSGNLDLLASALAIEGSILSNFILNDIWTFRDRRVRGLKAALTRAAKYHLISGGYATFFYAGYVPFTRLLGMYDLIAVLLAALIGLVWNFSLNILWTWRRGETLPQQI